MTDVSDDMSVLTEYCGRRSHCCLVQILKAYSDTLEVGGIGNVLTFQQKQNVLERKATYRSFLFNRVITKTKILMKARYFMVLRCLKMLKISVVAGVLL